MDESDAFMKLPDAEIAGCISDIGVPFSAADLQKPNAPQIQLIFEWFAELLMNATRETVEPAMRAASNEICGDYPDIITNETRNLMGFYVSLRRLLVECGIQDFSFQDLTKPTYERMVKIFSYIINFVRFRESQTAVIDEHFNKAEHTKARIEALIQENQEMVERVEQMRRSRKALEGQVQPKIRRNEELKKRLIEAKHGQPKIVQHFEKVKAKKVEMTTGLEEKTTTTVTLKQESEKLRPYVLQSPAALQASLGELSSSLNADKAQIDSLDRRSRALQTSGDTFNIAASDVSTCTRLLSEISEELKKEEAENSKATRHRDALSERSNNVRDVERQEGLLTRQLAKWHERTEKLREGSNERNEWAKKKTGELRETHRILTEERLEKSREMEARRVRIEQTEKKMVGLKENIENEIHSAHDEFQKMDSHIKLYITEMEQSISQELI